MTLDVLRPRQRTLDLSDKPSAFFEFDLIFALAKVFDHDGQSPVFHSLRVALLADALYSQLTSGTHSRVLLYAALLHDIGGAHLYPHIAVKLCEHPDTLTQKSIPEVFFHAVWGEDLLQTVPGLKPVARIVGMHHETVAGTGFPKGITVDELPIEVQLLAAADAFELTMREHGENIEEVLSSLNLLTGERFTQTVFELVAKTLEDDNLVLALLQPSAAEERIKSLRNELPQEALLNTWNAVEKLLVVAAEVVDRSVSGGHTGHIRRTTILAREIARTLGLPTLERRDLIWASYLQNVGQALLPRYIFSKPGKLEESEQHLLHQHPVLSAEIVSSIEGFDSIAPIVRHHHENWDGSGYPDGISGNKIPLLSRIIRVADAFDAMTSERPHNKKRDWRRALREIKRGTGKQFDPMVVEALEKTLQV